MAATRSPNYPAISLPEAIDLAEKVYQEAHTAPMEKIAVARAMEYKSLNGASLTKISALDKYGLLERSDSEYRISQDAVLILRGEKHSEERRQVLKKAVAAPKLFSDLLEKYGTKPPSEETVRAFLETRQKFKPDAARKAAKSFHDTLEFVSDEGVEYDPGGIDDENSASRQVEHSMASTGISTAATTGNELLRYRLERTCSAQVAFEGEVTQGAIEMLRKYLDLSKSAYPRRAEGHSEDRDRLENS